MQECFRRFNHLTCAEKSSALQFICTWNQNFTEAEAYIMPTHRNDRLRISFDNITLSKSSEMITHFNWGYQIESSMCTISSQISSAFRAVRKSAYSAYVCVNASHTDSKKIACPPNDSHIINPGHQTRTIACMALQECFWYSIVD